MCFTRTQAPFSTATHLRPTDWCFRLRRYRNLLMTSRQPRRPAPRIQVYSFELEGVTLLPVAEVEAQLAELIGQRVTLEDLRQAAARVTALYRRHGYFLARAYVPAQKINGGGVRIAVLEGRYDGVEASGSARLDDAQVDKTLRAQGVAPGEPIEQKSLERSLILLEQWVGAPTSAVLQPGASIGTSTLRIDAPSGRLFSGSLGADSFGNRYTGEQRAVASMQLNSPLGIGDTGELWAAYSSGARALVHFIPGAGRPPRPDASAPATRISTMSCAASSLRSTARAMPPSPAFRRATRCCSVSARCSMPASACSASASPTPGQRATWPTGASPQRR